MLENLGAMRSKYSRQRVVVGLFLLVGFFLANSSLAQQDKAPAKSSLTGSYQGTAKTKSQDEISVTFELTDNNGALSGMIRSSRGDFPITGGSHQGDAVTIQFDAGGPGTIELRRTEDKLVGTWSAGDDGGSVEVKKVSPQPETPKAKS